MKRILTIQFMLVSVFAFSQKQAERVGDSLLHELASDKYATYDNVAKARLLDQIARYYIQRNPAEALKFGNKELELGMASHDKNIVAHSNKTISMTYLQMAQFPKALEAAFASLKAFEELNVPKNTGNENYDIGNIYRRLNQMPKAIEFYNRALQLYRQTNDSDACANVYYSIGCVYQEQSEPDKALEFMLQAIKMYEQSGNNFGLAVSHLALANAYSDLRAWGKSIENFREVLKINEKLHDDNPLTSCYESMGETYIRMETDTTGTILRKGANIANLDSADKYLASAKALAQKMDDAESVVYILKFQALSASLRNNYKGAYNSIVEYYTLKDSIFSTDNKVKIAGLETKREAELKEKQIEINKIQEAGKKKERALYIIGLGMLGIIIVLILRNYSKQKYTNQQLAKEKTKSDDLVRRQGELLQQKDVLMKEIHHRVKNNLQVISTLLDLQLATVNEESAREAMTESTTRVRSISLIHQQLYQNEDLTTIEFAKFAKDLHFQVNTVFQQMGKKVAFENDVPETLLDIDTAVPLGLILNELMTNSYKYAFTGSDSGTINIRLDKTSDGYELVYKDSGPGLPEGFNADTSKSLGIRVMRSLSKQLGGKFVYVYGNKLFVVTFKDLEGRKMVD